MLVIGELLNGMYKQVAKAIQAKDKKTIQKLAKEQLEAGAQILDLNCGPLSKDPLGDMLWLIETVEEVAEVSLSLDSTKSNVIAEGLARLKNKGIVNSTSADEEKLETLIPLAKKHNASLIGLTLDKKGVPQDKDRRLELAVFIVEKCQAKGFPLEDLYLDPVILPLNVAQNQAKEVLGVLTEFKVISSPSPKTILGLSNLSQGTHRRSLLNRTFLAMAIYSGLDAAILDPLDKELMDTLIAAEFILNRHIYCPDFLEAYRKK